MQEEKKNDWSTENREATAAGRVAQTRRKG